MVLVHMVLSNKSNKQLILITQLKQKTNQQQQQNKFYSSHKSLSLEWNT